MVTRNFKFHVCLAFVAQVTFLLASVRSGFPMPPIQKAGQSRCWSCEALLRAGSGFVRTVVGAGVGSAQDGAQSSVGS